MKKLLVPILAAAAMLSHADTRTKIPTHAQVAGVSNQVQAVEAKVDANTAAITATALDIEAVKSLIVGGEAASPFLGGIRITYNTGTNHSVPQGEDYTKAISGAYITAQLPNQIYSFPVSDITAGAVQQVFVPCDDFVDVRLRLHLGPAKRIYPAGEQVVHVRQGQLVDAVIDTYPPLNPPSGEEETYRMVGRAQYYDPTDENGKRTTGASFPIQRVWDSEANAWVTQFGFYSNSVWHTECDIYNQIPQLDSTGSCVNVDEIGNLEHAYEAKAFPWNECEGVAVRIDPAMLNDNGQATPATNLFYFSRVPIYVYKETIETLTITNLAANGTVSSTGDFPMQIHWVARPEITNGYDTAFYIPSWEKVYKRVPVTNELEEVLWTTECLGVKEANYYACYKTAPTSAKNNNWRMAGNNNYTLQSYPWPYRDGSNYGVAGLSRGTMNSYARKLNPYAITMSRLVDGTQEGEAFATYADPTGTDMEGRRWAGNTWHDYKAFLELAYIQFGANAQATSTEIAEADGIPRITGIVGNNNSGILEARQDDLEFYYTEQTNLVTFTIAPRSSNGPSFSWLRILNFWGSEGDQMADVTTVAETDADGTKSIWYLANLDRARFIPDSSGSATSYATFTDNYGYERLSYYWAYTGLSGTYYRGKDSKADYEAFNLVRTTPASTTDLFAINLSSSPYDGVYAPSSYPTQPASGIAYSYWMCSLSNSRNTAIGPWYVFSIAGPSYASGSGWGARPSLNILAAECEAQSGGGE